MTKTKQQPDWKQLEQIVAQIQRQLAPNAEVRHNHHVRGRTGSIRKLDVTVTQKIGIYSAFIVFDCKRHSKPVERREVAAFAEQLEDVDANLGVMISESGFDTGAKAVAAQKNIVLQTYRKANETDWKEIFGENAWAALTYAEIPDVRALAVARGSHTEVEIPFNELIYNERGEVVGNLKDLFWSVWKRGEQPIGDVRVNLKLEGGSCFIKHNERSLIAVCGFVISAKLIARMCLVNLYLAEGDILEDHDSGKQAYQQVISKSFDWMEMVRTQQGIELSPEEYERLTKESRMTADLSNTERYIRIVAQKTDEARAHG